MSRNGKVKLDHCEELTRYMEILKNFPLVEELASKKSLAEVNQINEALEKLLGAQ